MFKRINILFFVIFSFFLLSTVIIQSYYQHWSGQWDLDFWYIYNASLMASGIEQEWYDHPATTILSIYSIFYQIYGWIDSSFVFNINQIINSPDPNSLLQEHYFVTRIFDSINVIFIVFFIFKICKLIGLKDYQSYVLILTLVLSKTFFNNFSIINPEDWAVLFFLISFYYFLLFFQKQKIIYIVFSGILFCLSFFSKISILFLFLFTIVLIPLLYEIYCFDVKKSRLLKFLKKNFNFVFIFYILFLISYTLIQLLFFSKFDIFEKNVGLDALIIILINFSYLLFFFLIARLNITKFKNYFSILIIFISGFFLNLLFFLFLEILNIVKFNPWVVFHLTNPFNEMIRFAGIDNSINFSTNSSFFLISLLENFFSNFKFDNFFSIVLISVFIISTFQDLKSKNYNMLFLKFILFFCFIFNILTFNIRFFIEYVIFAHVLFIILLSFCLKDLKKKYVNLICVIFLIYNFVLLPYKDFESFKDIVVTRENNLNSLCLEGSEFRNYSKKFKDDTYLKICN